MTTVVNLSDNAFNAGYDHTTTTSVPAGATKLHAGPTSQNLFLRASSGYLFKVRAVNGRYTSPGKAWRVHVAMPVVTIRINGAKDWDATARNDCPSGLTIVHLGSRVVDFVSAAGSVRSKPGRSVSVCVAAASNTEPQWRVTGGPMGMSVGAASVPDLPDALRRIGMDGKVSGGTLTVHDAPPAPPTVPTEADADPPSAAVDMSALRVHRVNEAKNRFMTAQKPSPQSPLQRSMQFDVQRNTLGAGDTPAEPAVASTKVTWDDLKAQKGFLYGSLGVGGVAFVVLITAVVFAAKKKKSDGMLVGGISLVLFAAFGVLGYMTYRRANQQNQDKAGSGDAATDKNAKDTLDAGAVHAVFGERSFSQAKRNFNSV